jgi:hypothetical protein
MAYRQLAEVTPGVGADLIGQFVDNAGSGRDQIPASWRAGDKPLLAILLLGFTNALDGLKRTSNLPTQLGLERVRPDVLHGPDRDLPAADLVDPVRRNRPTRLGFADPLFLDLFVFRLDLQDLSAHGSNATTHDGPGAGLFAYPA